MRYAAAYAGGYVVCFFSLTYYWAKVRRPIAWKGYSNAAPWRDDQIAIGALLFSVVWPVALPVLVFFAVGTAWVARLTAPPPPAPPENPYDALARLEVEKLLREAQ